ncbi:high affinity immunoglobulin gamma Fc receptor I-like [Micropterus salmoides]|uniref:high affinity immunoglobulin gamma Fc receptor I-like n=1 Tax=Micropterus salmoides TaxID=27706 RepID=UPI0018EA54F5|nr:high affinity immunoglobulin gamma Fc receptor I-like [Micropterus salmoides]
MEVTALCIRLLMTVLVLLVAQVQTSEAAFRIVPNRLQLFEYESVQFTCEGFNVSSGWKVWNIKGFIKKCSNGTVTTTVSCTIDYAFVSDSGEYWCEGEGGERSNTVNITVTAGSVILESPVLPVMEREAVTLSCRNKKTSTNITADFYKDGLHIRTSSTGEMTIHNVSKSDEGLYKCSISGAGESAESWLTVSTCNKGEGMLIIFYCF